MVSNSIELPFEILRTIFLLSLKLAYPFEATSFHKYVLEPSYKKEPLSYTHVCRWWRAVALAVPELWKAVSGTRDWVGYTSPGVLSILDATRPQQLNHEGRRTFPASIARPASPPRQSGASMEKFTPRTVKVLAYFWNQITLCRSLSLTLDLHLIPHFYNLIKDKNNLPAMPLLEDVELVFISRPRASQRKATPSSPGLSPCPPSAACAGPTTRRIIKSSPRVFLGNLPFEKLDTLSLTSAMPFKVAMCYIGRCTSATTVHINNLETFNPSAFELHQLDQPILELPNLRSLTLEGGEDPSLALSYLTLPGLKHLKVIKLMRRGPMDGRELEAFFRRSGCSLNKLYLEEADMASDTMVSFLATPVVQKIKELILVGL
ncbi:hypothetical protein NLJ89_g3909 [Agrocybe chaxingu]|uniref:F-box domain-containing protein n=1 Tax=Agrocybe chaxingu TaxID=84603 RepID=A0A9W8MYA7_9AGAR|nr:hypothetical protein NLJ89_g3909 [Agrocybe chaxingu]